VNYPDPASPITSFEGSISISHEIFLFMLLTGKPITSQEALNAGLLSRLVKDSNELEDEVQAICEAIINKPRAVVSLGID
jgi:enoyl-CoA hydratase/carnithine racemase